MILSMDWISGGSLKSIIEDKSRTVDSNIFYKLCLDITLALYFISENKLYHLDVKPSNIMYSDESGTRRHERKQQNGRGEIL